MAYLTPPHAYLRLLALLLLCSFAARGAELLPDSQATMTLLTCEEPPLNFTDESGLIKGISVDMVKAIQTRLGQNDPIQSLPWARAFKQATDGTANIVLFTANRTPNREQQLHWIARTIRNAWTVYSHEDFASPVRSLNDLKKAHSIGVLRGGAREEFLRKHGFTNIVPAAEFTHLYTLLAKRRVDMIFFSESALSSLEKSTDIDFRQFKPLFTVYPPGSYITLSKATPEATVARWRQAAASLREDGTFDQIAHRWQDYLMEHHQFESHVAEGSLNLWSNTRQPDHPFMSLHDPAISPHQ